MKHYWHWILASFPSVVVESSLRGSVVSNTALQGSVADPSSSCPKDCRQLNGQRFACHACPHCQWYQQAQECQDYQFNSDHVHHPVAQAQQQANHADMDNKASSFCGCTSCTQTVWDRDANGFSCGFRIHYYTTIHGGNHTMEQACTRVAKNYPHSCLACLPTFCDTPQKDVDSFLNNPDANPQRKEALQKMGVVGSTH